MTMPIGSSTKAAYLPPVLSAAQQVKAKGADSDGDNDGSKAASVAQPTTTSGPVGSKVNTTA